MDADRSLWPPAYEYMFITPNKCMAQHEVNVDSQK